MPGQSATVETLRALTQFDTPTIANAMDSLQITNRCFSGTVLRAISPQGKAVCGIAVTATMKGQWAGKFAHIEPWLRFLEEIEMAQLPVIAAFEDRSEIAGRDAMIGEGMSLSMRLAGAHGVLCDGAVRDIEAIRDMHFPVWANGLVADRGNIRFHEFQVPVCVGGMEVSPGDVIHADENGALIVPLNRIDEIVVAAAEVNRQEASLFEMMKSSGFRISHLREHYAVPLKAAMSDGRSEF